ncbi:MAG: hypothetical protein ACTSY1_02415 [Alphaproteobacteria bacterium]
MISGEEALKPDPSQSPNHLTSTKPVFASMSPSWSFSMKRIVLRATEMSLPEK